MSEVHNSTVSIVVPTLGEIERLRVSLPSLVHALEARGFEPDEIVVVDDSGADRASTSVPEILGSLDSSRKRLVHVISTDGRLGFAEAVLKGAQRARGSLLFICQDDVELTEGALKALTGAMRDDDVFAAGPMIVQSVDRDGDDQYITPHLRLSDDRLEVLEAVSTGSAPEVERASFVPATALMVRRETFLELGGFDPLFAPFSWDDVDLGISARRRGLGVLRVGDARVIHHTDLPSIWTDVESEVATAVIERNRLLLRWKHLATRADATEHLVSLWRQVLEAGLTGDRETLERVCLAFESLPEVTASRAQMAGVQRELADVL